MTEETKQEDYSNRKRLKNYLEEQYKKIKNLKERKYKKENTKRVGSGRSDYQRDYARIMYSSSFRRLQGKMQFLGLEAEQFFRNRLTHSLEVSQIAEGIISVLNEKIGESYSIYTEDDIYIVRAACLAHDIGNPPFGHAGETVLNELMSDNGGFEGNAQTLRILTEIEKKSGEYKGLNLTYRTQLALLKYYNTKRESNKKFIYEKEYNDLNAYIKENGIDGNIRTLDAQIMDLADEIAYSAHDLEDCLSLKVFDIDELLYEFKQKNENDYTKLKDIVEKAKEKAMKSTILKIPDEYNDILRKEITSEIVTLFINDIDVVEIGENDRKKFGTTMTEQLGFKTYSSLAKNLKTLTFESLKRRKYVKLYEERGKQIIKMLFKLYSKCPHLMSNEYEVRYNLNYENRKRVVCDYISGMMDSYAIKKYKEYFGEINFNHLIESK